MKTMEPISRDTKKKVTVGAVGLSLFFHLGLFLLVGGAVVVEYAVPHHPMTGEMPPTVDTEDPVPDEKSEPLNEPDVPDAPTTATAAASQDPAPVNLSVSTVDVLTVNAPVTSFQMPTLGGTGGTGTGVGQAGTGTGVAGQRKGGKISNPFGGDTKASNTWEGTLYDLKQTRDGKPSGMNPDKKYFEVLNDFFKKNWNRKVLDDYYQVKKTLYTSQIYIPFMNAAAAPQAFKVADEVQPSQWVVLYEGSFQTLDDTPFRLAGYADDVIVVRVNGRTVLDGSRTTMMANNKPQENPLVKVSGQEFVSGHRVTNGCLAYSDWMHFSPGDVNKLEVLVGERPGGEFCAFLLVEEKGKTYEKDSNGRSILPIFRTIDAETNAQGVPFDANGPVFGVK